MVREDHDAAVRQQFAHRESGCQSTIGTVQRLPLAEHEINDDRVRARDGHRGEELG
jgi:hypothetical protein